MNAYPFNKDPMLARDVHIPTPDTMLVENKLIQEPIKLNMAEERYLFTVPEMEQGSTTQALMSEAQVQLSMYCVRRPTRMVTAEHIAAHGVAGMPSKCHLTLARNCRNGTLCTEITNSTSSLYRNGPGNNTMSDHLLLNY